jgi:type II secretory pathway component PulF
MRESTKSKKVSTDNKVQILIQEAIFFEKFGELIGADVPLLRAMEIAATSIQDRTLQSMFLQMIPKLDHGQSITDVLRQYPDYFTSFHLAIIETGEKDGHLEDGFSRVAESMRNEAESMERNGNSTEIPTTHSTPRTPADHLSQISKELSVISSHLANVSQQLSRLTKRSTLSNHKKAKPKR